VTIGHASLCYSADDKDPSTSPRGSPVASSVVQIYLLISGMPLTHLNITRNEPPSASTVNATSEFRKIRQSLSLLESHLTTVQRAPRPPPDVMQSEARIQPQRGLLAHLNSPLSSWPTQLNPGVGPTGWISYLGMRVRSSLPLMSISAHLYPCPTFSRSQISKKNIRRPVTAVQKPYWLDMSRTTTWSG
jgi:hypothetical protein